MFNTIAPTMMTIREWPSARWPWELNGKAFAENVQCIAFKLLFDYVAAQKGHDTLNGWTGASVYNFDILSLSLQCHNCALLCRMKINIGPIKRANRKGQSNNGQRTTMEGQQGRKDKRSKWPNK